MEEVNIEDKGKFLEENYPFRPARKLTDWVHCIHCGETYEVRHYKVMKYPDDDFLYISCANSPRCDGTVIDWMPSTKRKSKVKK